MRVNKSHTFPLDSSSSDMLSVPSPHSMRSGSSSSHFSFYEQPELDHLQIPDFAGMTHQTPQYDQSSPSGFVSYQPRFDPNFSAPSPVPMTMETMPGTMATTGYWPASHTSSSFDPPTHSGPETTLALQDAFTAMAMPSIQAQFEPQNILMPIPRRTQSDELNLWHVTTPDGDLGLDDAAIQQAVADAFHPFSSFHGQSPDSRPIFRSRSYMS